MTLEECKANINKRVELHPATDLWMRGVRFVNIRMVGRIWVECTSEKLNRPIKVLPENILKVID